ncbi:MAG: hypothetical protein QXF35_01430 [Candidatus Bilamarchaeaceae archaeon]
MNKLIIFLSLFSLFLIFGCYGLQKPSECQVIQQPAEQMACYKRAAIGYAYAGDEVGVRVMCNEISNIGQAYAYQGYNDVEKTARVEANQCYYESAKIIATTEAKGSAIQMCEEITESQSAFGLSYAGATKEKCKREVNKIIRFAPDKYYSTPGNICALSGSFIVLLAGIFFRNSIH